MKKAYMSMIDTRLITGYKWRTMSQVRRIWTDDEIVSALVADPTNLKATLAIAHQHAPNLKEFAEVVIAHPGSTKLGLTEKAVVDGVKKAVSDLSEKPEDWSLTRWLRCCVEKRAQQMRTVHLL